MKYGELLNVTGSGIEVVSGFASPAEIGAVAQEADDPERIPWTDAHAQYRNQRGLLIIQNHFTFAVKLGLGDQSFRRRLPATIALLERTQGFINDLASIFPSLTTWKANELSLHLYDDQEVGLSRHRDNERFIGVVAIAAISGRCDLVSTRQERDTTYKVKPGDLCLLRAPGLIETKEEVRPEHSVQNLEDGTRLSMIIRNNSRPDAAIKGFTFNNWPLGGQSSD